MWFRKIQTFLIQKDSDHYEVQKGSDHMNSQRDSDTSEHFNQISGSGSF